MFASGCTRCQDVCPVTAIRFPETNAVPTVVAACIECGICQASCPSQAITGVGVDADVLYRRIANAYESEGGVTTVRLWCGDDGQITPATGDGIVSLRIPCLGAVDLEALVAALRVKAARRLELVCSECRFDDDQCHAAALAKNRLVGLLAEVCPDLELVERGQVLEPVRQRWWQLGARRQSTKHAVSRRGFLTMRLTQERTPAPDAAIGAGAGLARQRLLACAPQLSLPQVSIEQGCTLCGACAALCPTGAITVDGTEGTVSFDANGCIDCGECARICPEDVLSIGEPRPGPHARVVLVQGQTRQCVRCGVELAPGEVDICTNCTSRALIFASV